LLEIDVSGVRHFIEEHEAQTGEALSFTGPGVLPWPRCR
jgi:hypothetical protein